MATPQKLLSGALDVARAIALGDPAWRRGLVDLLAEDVGADTVGYASWSTDRPSEMLSENVGGPPLTDEEREAWSTHMLAYPFFARLLLDHRTDAVRTSDLVPSMRSFRSSAVFNDLLAPRHAKHQANLALLDEGGEVAIVGLYRSTRDFTPCEVDALEAARVVLAAALLYRRRADAAALLVGRRSDAEGCGLTSREQQVLGMVATGATNAQIGARLGITVRTVRKHLESIFTKLDVSSRTAAVAVWRTPRSPRPR